MKKISQKGQIFSLDFLIAAGLTVLAIGMLLNYYDLQTGQAKEARVQGELNIVALTASEMMLRANACVQDGTSGGTVEFIDQGYKLYNCADLSGGGSKFKSMKKTDLLVPEGFSCRITWVNLATDVETQQDNDASIKCNSTVPEDSQDVAVVERLFLGQSPSTLLKKDYSKCMEIANSTNCTAAGAGTKIYEIYKLRVKIWK